MYLILGILFWLVGEVRFINSRWKKIRIRLNEGAKAMRIFNHRISKIEKHLTDCNVFKNEDPIVQPPLPGLIDEEEERPPLPGMINVMREPPDLTEDL